MDAVEKVARFMWDQDWGSSGLGDWETGADSERSSYLDAADRMIAAFPQLALEGREEWEYAQATPSYGYDDEQNGWHVGKSFHGDPNRALDEGFTLVRRALGPWSEVQS